MSTPIMYEKEQEKQKDPLLEDGGTLTLECSSCGKKLVNIWITRPGEKVVNKVKATCCFCGDASFTKTIKGGFGFEPYGKLISERDVMEDVIIENIETDETSDGYRVKFITKKRLKR